MLCTRGLKKRHSTDSRHTGQRELSNFMKYRGKYEKRRKIIMRSDGFTMDPFSRIMIFCFRFKHHFKLKIGLDQRQGIRF